jgi:hypothetical protein
VLGFGVELIVMAAMVVVNAVFAAYEIAFWPPYLSLA